LRLKDKVAIVTGTGRGIGWTTAIELASEGADVAVTSISDDKDNIEKLAQVIKTLNRRALPIICDVSDENSVIAMVQSAAGSFGKIDILVNNAGIAGPVANVVDMDLADWNKTLAVNLTGTMLSSREVLKHMIPRNSGVIINIASNVGRRGLAMRTPYVCSKWAQIGFTQTLAREVAKNNIRVNSVCPGAVEGERIKFFIGTRANSLGISYEEAYRQVEAEALLGRMVTPKEIAAAVIFLASDASSGITGQSLNVCCGTVFS